MKGVNVSFETTPGKCGENTGRYRHITIFWKGIQLFKK
jgi:hypothetical protein